MSSVFKGKSFGLVRAVMLVFLLAFGVNERVNAGLTDGLVAYWSFDDCTAKDVSGNGHGGSQIGTTCSDGINKKSLTFNGSSDYVEVPNTTELSLTTAMTVSAWVKPNGSSMDGCKNSSIKIGVISK